MLVGALGRLASVDEQPTRPERDRFKVVAVIALAIGGLAILGGLVLVVAAFLIAGT